jgi:hypothetical protein
MHGLYAAPLAELCVLDLPLDLLLVLVRIIIPPLAGGAAKSDETV